MSAGLALEPHLLRRYAALRHEPPWMGERRSEAMRLFEQAPMPQWDRTDVSGLDLGAYLHSVRSALEAPQPPSRVELSSPTRLDGEWPAALVREVTEIAGGAFIAQVVSRPGRPVRTLRFVDPELRRRGLVVAPLDEAVQELPELVQRHFMTRAILPEQGKFQALHGAAWDVGTLIYVPPGLELPAPVQVVTWMEEDRLTLFPHVLVVLDRHARATVVETQVSAEPAGGLAPLVAGAVEVVAGPGSRVDYVSLQTWDHRVTAFISRRAVLEADSQVEWIVGEFGCGLARGEFESELEGQGSSSHTVLVFFADGSQHMDLLNAMNHRARHTESDIVARGVLAGHARGIYRAVTHIHSGARDSGAFQRGNILVLSPKARADANPSVVVQESEVRRAGHAATVGQVDREQLFYLMSRGIPEKVAIGLIVEGFLQPVLDRIPAETARERIRRIVAARLGAQ